MIHRDIKPSNIVWTWDGDKPHIYLTDFGIAQNLDANWDPGETGGTVDYMSPEQFYGYPFLPNDKPFDIWGAGLVLTELVS